MADTGNLDQELRVWQRRAASRDPALRHEAERRVADLAQQRAALVQQTRHVPRAPALTVTPTPPRRRRLAAAGVLLAGVALAAVLTGNPLVGGIVAAAVVAGMASLAPNVHPRRRP